MVSDKTCCVPHCKVTRDDKLPLHSFPNPQREPERFRTWMVKVGGDVLALDNNFVYKYRRVCHKHFEQKYYTWTNTLSRDAVPTLQLSGWLSKRRQTLSDVTNVVIPGGSQQEQLPSPLESVPSTSDGHALSTSTESKPVPGALTNIITSDKKKKYLKKSKKQPKITKKEVNKLEAVIIKLRNEKDKYATRLKKAFRLSENKSFQNALNKFTTLAAIFTLMQFREISKDKMGRRFTKEEKLMALSLYKQGPRAYRWLSKVFILPSPLTLSRLLAKAGIKPGINKNIFQQLKKRAGKMKNDEKLCTLLFDEMSITPHFDFNNRKDKISGFVTNGHTTKRNIADHALVFMIRGVIHNYKQPIAYTFCRGSTPADELKILIRNIITEIQNCGLTVLATVCDQGATNVSAINKLIQETKESSLREGEEHVHDSFIINEAEIFPLYDSPHLIKGIRNNLITKNLTCKIDGAVKIAKWDHITKLYQENPAYKGIRLIKNLTELHVEPKKIPKMKVKYATQIFSKTVATTMGYLAEKGVLPEECQDTADVLLFFDDLFDAVNGSHVNSTRRSGKPLLGAVTPKSEHSSMWKRAKCVLSTMTFVTKDGKKEGKVPSVKNWIITLENMEHVKNKLFMAYNCKSLWMRHFNQDPLENFFGCIRSHGCRNTSPTPSGFETAFVSLLITNLSSNSRGSNCEEDNCTNFDAMSNLFSQKDVEDVTKEMEINENDLYCDFEDFEQKRKNVKIAAQLCYVSGFILRKCKINIFKKCAECTENLSSTKNPNDYLIKREYFKFKKALSYPSEPLIKCFSQLQDIITYLLQNKSEAPEISMYCKTIISVNIDFNFIKCEIHREKLTNYLVEVTILFFLTNWCRDINKIINGTRSEIISNENESDVIKKLACDFYKKKNKRF